VSRASELLEQATPLRKEVRRVITNAYYDCRNEGETMETAADRAADSVMAVLPDYEAAVAVLERIIAANEGLELNGAEEAHEVLARLRELVIL